MGNPAVGRSVPPLRARLNLERRSPLHCLGLFERPESVREELTHLIRGFIFPLALGVLLLGEPVGLFFWGFIAVFALDLANSLIDVLVEPASRAPEGVPLGELAVHFIGGGVLTVAFTLFVTEGWAKRTFASAMVPHATGWLTSVELGAAWLAVIGGGILFVFETVLFCRAVLARKAGPPLPRLQSSQP